MSEYITMAAACIVSGALREQALFGAQIDGCGLLLDSSILAFIACACAGERPTFRVAWPGRGGDA